MKSIAIKLWLGMLALVVFMLILLWFFQIAFLENLYMNQQIAMVKNEGLSIAKSWVGLTQEQLSSKLEELEVNYKARVYFTDSKGNLLAAGERGPMMMRNMIQGDQIRRVLDGETVIYRLRHQNFTNEFAVIGIPIKEAGSIRGALFINMPLAPVKETAGILKGQLIYITVILLIAASIFSYVLSRLFTKPILEIIKAAGEMASGNLSIRLDTKSGDEIGKLAGTMNYLSEQLSKIEQLRRDLVANVSHELRTPLSLIRGYAETIRDISGDIKDKRDRQLGIIIEEAERLGKIVDDILHLSQMQSGNLKLEMGEVHIGRILEDIAKRYELVSEKNGTILELQADSGLTVMADEQRIEQVFYNLINNAFNHTATGDIITIRVTDLGSRARIEVADTGPGISKLELPYIWDRYFKAVKASGRSQAGTGLGLAIVKSILEAHDSKYGVESAEGQGTVFWFELNKAIYS